MEKAKGIADDMQGSVEPDSEGVEPTESEPAAE
jgi:hypothetical protein